VRAEVLGSETYLGETVAQILSDEQIEN
jgi:hypothetical protein